MRWIALGLTGLVALVGFAGPVDADTRVVYRTAPSADIGLPFRCDWGYDWDERCYTDFFDRLPVGGDDDKVWRSALRFPLDAIPPGSVVDSAMLQLSFDGVCLAPRRTQRPCPARFYTIDVHPVLSRDWSREREVELGPRAEQATLWAGAPQRLAIEVTNLVIDWVQHGVPNNGLLLKLADGEEDFSVSGPKFPSAEFADTAFRPVLEVTYIPP